MYREYINLIKDFFNYIKIAKKQYTIYIIGYLLNSSFKIFIILLTAFALNNFETLDINMVIKLLTVGGAAIVCYVFSSKYISKKLSVLNQSIIVDIQQNILNKYKKASLRESEKMNSGEFLTLFSSDVENVANFFTSTFISILNGMVQYIIVIIYGIFVSYQLTILVVILSVFAFLLPKFFKKVIVDKSIIVKESEEKNKDFMLGILNLLSVIIANNKSKFIKNKLQIKQSELIVKRIDYVKNTSLMHSISVTLGLFTTIFWIAFGLILINYNYIMVGTLFAFMNLSDFINWPFMALPFYSSKLFDHHASLLRLREMNRLENAVYNSYDTNKKDEIVASNIYFSYNDKDIIIKDFSIKIKPNQKYIIVGESGKGKSTLFKLLMGVYRPDKGEVTLLNSTIGEGISCKISYVPQTPSLFSDTIAYNILLKNIETEEDYQTLVEVAKKVKIYDFIMKLEDEFDTVIGDGNVVKLSAGQLQRIALARAIVKKSDIIFMDEMSSALDRKTEADILELIESLSQSVVIISHRDEVINRFKNHNLIDINNL